MSECPNCGSAKDTTLLQQDFECGSWNMRSDGGPTGFHKTPACQLIQSLREELAAAKDQMRVEDTYHDAELAAARDAERDRIADHLELRASKLEDELAISETSTEIGLERILAVIKSLRKEAQALRNNEHRSDT